MAKRIPTYCPRCWWDIEIHGLKFEPVNVDFLCEENERLKATLDSVKAITAKWVPNPPDKGGWYDPDLAKTLMDDICDTLGEGGGDG